MRRPFAALASVFCTLAFASCARPTPSVPSPSKVTPVPQAPVAKRVAHDVPSPSGARQDPYYWLRDDERKDPEMLAYLAAENAWKDQVLAPLKPLEDALFDDDV